MSSARRRADLLAALTAAACIIGTLGFVSGTGGRAIWAVWCVAAVAHTLLGWSAASPTRRRSIGLALSTLCTAVMLCLVPPVWSDDIARYVLDGRVSAAGLHPLVIPPASPKVLDLVVGLPIPPNHPHLPSIYPPAAQAAFAAVFGTGLGLSTWRLLLVAGVAMACWRDRAARFGALPRGLAIAAHPLCLVAIAGEGHVDALGVIALTVLLAGRMNAVRLGVVAALGAGIKLFPLIWAFGAARLPRPRRALMTAVGVSALLFGASLAPMATAGGASSGSFATYSTTWTHHASVFDMARGTGDFALHAVGVGPSVEIPACTARRAARDDFRWYRGQPSHQCYASRSQLADLGARALGGLLLLASLVWSARVRAYRPVDVMVVATTVLWLVSPVVHPWYLLWLLPLAVHSRAATPWCFVGCAMGAYYAAASFADNAGWVDAIEVRVAAYLPVFAALMFDSRRRAAVGSGAVPT